MANMTIINGIKFAIGKSIGRIAIDCFTCAFSLTCDDINGDGYGDLITGQSPCGAGVIFGQPGKQAYSYSTLSSSGQVGILNRFC